MNDAEKKIKEIISRYIGADNDFELFIFGSRSDGTAKKYSDYDIGIMGSEKVPREILSKIKTALDDSDLPYKVDVVDFFLASESFRKEALKNIRKL